MDHADKGMLLVVDDDRSVRRVVAQWLEQAGFRVEAFPDGQTCLNALARILPDAVCLDLHMPVMDGVTTLKRIKANHSHLPVVILTGDADVDTVVKTMRLGAYDYLVKPIDGTKLVTTMQNAVEKHRLAMRLVELEREVEIGGFPGIFGQCPPMKRLFAEMDRLADSDISVLIHGESGTGKELVAQAIHDNSGRRDGPFVAINCAAIPETLQESELFGYERGAFTGASTSRAGRFELANTGTLFFDEIGELSLSLQAKLLRVLQEKSFNRVGSNKEIQTDFRLLAATHRDLAELVRENRFREDLYFRIVVYELEIPPLRHRGDDIPGLARFFFKKYRSQQRDRNLRLSPEAEAAFRRFSWPGNVRELENVIQRAIVVTRGDVVQLADLPRRLRTIESDTSEYAEFTADPHAENDGRPPIIIPSATDSDGRPPLPIATIAQLEQWAIEGAYERSAGDVPQMVEELGIGRSTLYRKLKQYGLR